MNTKSINQIATKQQTFKKLLNSKHLKKNLNAAAVSYLSLESHNVI